MQLDLEILKHYQCFAPGGAVAPAVCCPTLVLPTPWTHETSSFNLPVFFYPLLNQCFLFMFLFKSFALIMVYQKRPYFQVTDKGKLFPTFLFAITS